MKPLLFVIANENFRDEELLVPKAFFEEKEIKITICAGKKGVCIGRFGTKVIAEKTLSEVSSFDFSATIFIGGIGAQIEYTGNNEYFRLASEAKEKTILAAICITPTVLSDSGIFQNKKVTGWNDEKNTQKNYLLSKGAIFTGEDLTIDKNIITANGPNAAKCFAEAIYLKILCKF